jgi:integrase
LFYGVLVREGLRVSEALALTWSDVDLERGVISLAHNKTDDPRTWALDPGVAEALRRWRRRFPMSLPSEAPVLVGPAGEQVDRFEAARELRQHLRLAGVNRVQLFETNDARIAIRAHDLRASFITVNLALGKTEAWITDRTGHRSSQMVYTYKRAARTFADLNLGGFFPLHEAIPELQK